MLVKHLNTFKTPTIIIGAPRSGTNMLRDILTKIPGFGTWPCDEINYIWRHGNMRYPSDVFPAELATPRVINFIRGKFEKLAKKQKVEHIIEKTCANSLRVDFVDRIFPNAKYIFIVRDGIDVVASAVKRWKAKLDLIYVLKKARYIPVLDIPFYASRYLYNRGFRLFSVDKKLSFWGPKLDNMKDILRENTLEEVCAMQWKESILRAENSFSCIDSNRVYTIRYEDFVRDPKDQLKKILCEFMCLDEAKYYSLNTFNNITQSSIGKGYKDLNQEQINLLKLLLNETLNKYGYLNKGQD